MNFQGPINSGRPNRLMHRIMILSILMHTGLFIYISYIYRANTLTYIELALHEIKNPVGRSIPKPRMKYKNPEASQVKHLKVPNKPFIPPDINPAKHHTAKRITEDIASPVIENLTAGNSIWNSGIENSFLTQKDYLDVLKLKIESRKKYPEDARKKQIEGRVVVQFLVTRDGQLSSLKIVKSARHASLDQAALNAVEAASPFSILPSNLFSGPLRVELVIVFEIT